ncbi:MAG: PorT family protein [Bacteroidota bacterium]|nr:PorT family protein [Bacteroidota bacterium]
MKKLTLILIGLCLSLSSVAQTNKSAVEEEKTVWSVGTLGGFGPAWLKPYSSLGLEPSWNVGLSVIYSPWEHAALGADLRLSVEGGRVFSVENYTKAPQLTYLRVPLKGIYFFRDYEDDLRPKIAFGPSIGVLTNEKRSTGARALDIGAQASVGLNYRIANEVWLTGDVNYYHGMVDVYPSTTLRERNRHFNFDVGLSFGF